MQVAAAEDLHIDPAELDTVIAIASGTVMPNPQIALFAALQRFGIRDYRETLRAARYL